MAKITIEIEKLGINFTRVVSDKLAKKLYAISQPTKQEKLGLEGKKEPAKKEEITKTE
jgi:hypothetical protein